MNSGSSRGKKKAGDKVPTVIGTGGLDNVVGYHLRLAQEASFAAYARMVGDTRIWPGWYSLLKIINDNPGINQTELSLATGRDKSTLTASLRELGKAGLVEKTRDETDRRNVRLILSAAGGEQLRQLESHALAHDKEIDRIVGSDNRVMFLQILKKLAEELKQRP
ncbi:MarR family winged helix-turn-helix transcriptional regulator [Sphingobium sp. BYY-5]|uniref:MarR family winged helix-turn-helix transcriptional regulator n=1 Tax=Sphingobium sp. BYY-5 TaxID=2926400 RepID=UPI001FA70A1F|nr:MarR family winged helix-turn-helix transcriptional regulator [Sphingobium sp. BYY-5]MCI4592379.1 MarR family winged helix-turn-helix transcriptional regulator [Sphingobium sp. BYY-5]